jgi:hypothetical protein
MRPHGWIRVHDVPTITIVMPSTEKAYELDVV